MKSEVTPNLKERPDHLKLEKHMKANAADLYKACDRKNLIYGLLSQVNSLWPPKSTNLSFFTTDTTGDGMLTTEGFLS